MPRSCDWLGLRVTVRGRIRARARECIFSLLFFISLLKVTNTFVLHVSSNCHVRGVRTTTVRDVTMMYSQEWYTENVPDFKGQKSNCSPAFLIR